MVKAYFDQKGMQKRLVKFFKSEKSRATTFGNTVNQTFEAFVFAALVAWYRKNEWKVELIHPGNRNSNTPEKLTLKYSTRGRPANYSYARCTKGKDVIQIHHQLRIDTRHHRKVCKHRANLCLDVAVIKETDVLFYSTDDSLCNEQIVTFGEAKHMSAFAELVASFIGMVHEMMPRCVKAQQKADGKSDPPHLPPFLYVSGILYKSALGIIETMRRRRLPIKVFSCTDDLTDAFKLHEGDFTADELRAKLKAEEKARHAAKRAKLAAKKKADRDYEKQLKTVPY